MTDPINFSKAFSADESKDFRGRPHERMFASLMAGVFMMAQGQYDVAMSYLRNAESLDARLKNALRHRCPASLRPHVLVPASAQKQYDQLKRAADGVLRSVRFLSLQEPLIKALVDIAEVDLRPMAIANRLAYMIFEISIYHSLISAPII